jgi:acetyl-CoA acyltransferase
MSLQANGRRAAIVDGLRTPFAKQGTVFKNLSALDLGRIVSGELISRSDIDPDLIEQVVYGQVIPSVRIHNIAREIVLSTGLPPQTDAYSVSRACATSYQTTINLMRAIEDGTIDCGLAGGAESTSVVPLTVTRELQQALLKADQADSLIERGRALADVRPADLVPQEPTLEEPSTGETMGEGAEHMAKVNQISRQAQDEFAHRSHVLAAEAWDEGKFDGEVMALHVPPEYEVTVTQDTIVRHDSQLEDYADLPPVFDKRHGTITAGNSSPLTDGASALIMMAEEKARAHGLPILGYIRSYAFTAVDPGDQLLIGPAYATPLALERAGMTLEDMALIDQHEAFSAQILSVIQAFESAEFARQNLGREEPVGKVDWDRFNVNGGSIALGHPFAATGVRQIIQTLHELRRRGEQFALCGACAAGGLAAAVVLEGASV